MTIESLIKDIPEFKPSRLSSLYSNFEHNKQLNPEGYEANITAWQILFTKLITTNTIDSQISIPTINLPERLTISIHGKPKNLAGILDELISRNFFIPESQLNNQDDNGSLFSIRRWWSRFTSGPYSISTHDGELKRDRLIIKSKLIELGDRYYDMIISEIHKSGNTYSSKLFNNVTLYNFLVSKIPTLTKIDFDIFLKYWMKGSDGKKCTVREIDGMKFIKFGDKQVEMITDDDIGIINIQSSITNLENRNVEFQAKINQIDTKSVLVLPKSEQKEALKKLLTRKKLLIKSYNHSSKLYDELSTILMKINDSNLNHEIYNQLVTSSKILQNMNSKVSLEDIDNVRLDIDEQIAKESEISEALVSTEEQHDDEELEDELKQLYAEVNKDKTAQTKEKTEDSELLDKLNKLTVTDRSPTDETLTKQSAEPIAN